MSNRDTLVTVTTAVAGLCDHTPKRFHPLIYGEGLRLLRDDLAVLNHINGRAVHPGGLSGVFGRES